MSEPVTNPIKWEDKYLKGLESPADKSQVLDKAKSNKTPKRVVDILHQLKDDRYENLGSLLEAIGDLAWDHG